MRRIALVGLLRSFALNGMARNQAPLKKLECYLAKAAILPPHTDHGAIAPKYGRTLLRLFSLQVLFMFLALIFPGYGNTQTRAPIAVQSFQAVPRIASPATDRLASSRIPEMMPFAAPLVLETPEITNTLVLANAAFVKTSATITLFSVSGKTSSRNRIELQPHEKKEYSLSSPQGSAALGDGWGSVTVEQDPSSMGVVVAGQVVVTDHRASTPAYIDEELAMPEMEGSSKLATVTDQSEGPPLLAITNLSSEIQHVSVTCLQDIKSPASAAIAGAAHATVRYEACSSTSPPTFVEYATSLEKDSLPGVYAIELDGDGPPGIPRGLCSRTPSSRARSYL
jgi:hypothetical protein